jgi:hypothetical protein
VLWETGTGAGSQINTQIHKNGAGVYISQSVVNTAVPLTQSGNSIVYLNGTTDYVTITGYTSSANGIQIIQSGGGTVFSASLI